MHILVDKRGNDTRLRETTPSAPSKLSKNSLFLRVRGCMLGGTLPKVILR
jgi:hypothetical protein